MLPQGSTVPLTGKIFHLILTCLAPPMCRRLDCSTNRIQRMIDIEVFNKPNSEVFIYILCTRAGGLGVNLQVGRDGGREQGLGLGRDE